MAKPAHAERFPADRFTSLSNFLQLPAGTGVYSLTMKKLLSILTLTAAGLIVAPCLTNAADEKPARPPGDRPHRGGGEAPNPEARLKMMTEKLGLTADQQAKIKAIFEKNAPAFKELMAKGRENLTDADKEKLKELMKSQHEEVDAVLTPEQKEKAKAMHGDRGPGHKPGGAKPDGEAK